jgi:hypothetical protein
MDEDAFFLEKLLKDVSYGLGQRLLDKPGVGDETC